MDEPLAETFITLPWLRKPPRQLSAGKFFAEMRARYVWDAVVLGHTIVDHGKIALHNVGNRMITFDQFTKTPSSWHGKTQVRFIPDTECGRYGEIHVRVEPTR